LRGTLCPDLASRDDCAAQRDWTVSHARRALGMVPPPHPQGRAVLVTLNDARTLIQQRFAHVIEWQGATRAFMAAAESGTSQDIAFATAKIEHLLLRRALL